MDAESLYTNIAHKNGLQAIRSIIPNNKTADHATELCIFFQTHNYLRFDEVRFEIS